MTEPMLPASLVPRAKMNVSGVQQPSLTPFSVLLELEAEQDPLEEPLEEEPVLVAVGATAVEEALVGVALTEVAKVGLAERVATGVVVVFLRPGRVKWGREQPAGRENWRSLITLVGR